MKLLSNPSKGITNRLKGVANNFVNLDLHSHCSSPIVNSKYQHSYGVSLKIKCLSDNCESTYACYLKKKKTPNIFYISNSIMYNFNPNID